MTALPAYQRVPPINQDQHFDALTTTVSSCRRCPRMEGRTRVLGRANGALAARVLFIAEAPGRFGADAVGIPLAGDRTGRTFELLLASAQLRRSDIFVTNAVLCNPRDAQGRNDRPAGGEIANCSSHLERLLTIIEPAWVVTLGVVALHALTAIEQHALSLQRDIGRPIPWWGRTLVPLYHPGPRALIRRPFQVQECDYQRLAALIGATPAQSS